ncbi:type II toxin-antitoxin system HicA family toxin [Scytonema sp. NUACC26]|uniref:type II toxin-antitoxin system HicA family toxin n=1 Tax=Scytonema sp. NUACC26 TaxID=3140176 RepID=UPI0038B36194
MSKLPRISGKECVKALQKVGFYQKRRESSHIILRRDEPFIQVVVRDRQELATRTLRAINYSRCRFKCGGIHPVIVECPRKNQSLRACSNL